MTEQCPRCEAALTALRELYDVELESLRLGKPSDVKATPEEMRLGLKLERALQAAKLVIEGSEVNSSGLEDG